MKHLAAILILATAATPMYAAEYPSLALDFPYATRSVGMGTSGVADDTDPANLFSNPATLGSTRGLWVNAALHNWTGDRNAFEFGVEGGFQPLIDEPRWTIAGAFSRPRADIRELVPGTRVKTATHESFTHATLASSFGGNGFYVAAGISGKWSTVEDASESFMDVGLLVGGSSHRGNMRYRYRAGWSVRNIDRRGPAPDGRDLDDTRVGVSLGLDAGLPKGDTTTPSHRTTPTLAITLNADAETDLDAGAAGIELLFRGTVALRGGYRDSLFPGRHASVAGIGVSHWFDFFFARLDYAFLETTDGTVHANSVALRLGFDL